MLKSTLAAALFGLAFIAPAFAADMKCDDATMKDMQAKMDAVTDAAMKDAKDKATKEMEMAMAAMKDNKMDDCVTHMQNAMKGMMKQ
jgi:hypothetical protein